MLSDAQINYFSLFGFLRLPRLFGSDAPRLDRGFEEVFAERTPTIMDRDLLHRAVSAEYETNLRQIVAPFVERSDDLSWLLQDPRIVGLTSDLGRSEYFGSDGNRFNSELAFHCDVFGAPVHRNHLKVYFYLDEIDANSGALRVLPGSHHPKAHYTNEVRRAVADPGKLIELLGVSGDELPAVVLDVCPGDVIVTDFRVIHGSFGGRPGRRLFTLNYREPVDDAEDQQDVPALRVDGGLTSELLPPP